MYFNKVLFSYRINGEEMVCIIEFSIGVFFFFNYEINYLFRLWELELVIEKILYINKLIIYCVLLLS